MLKSHKRWLFDQWEVLKNTLKSCILKNGSKLKNVSLINFFHVCLLNLLNKIYFRVNSFYIILILNWSGFSVTPCIYKYILFQIERQNFYFYFIFVKFKFKMVIYETKIFIFLSKIVNFVFFESKIAFFESKIANF